MATQTPDEFRDSLRRAGQTTFAQSLARKAAGLALFAEGEARKNATSRLRVRSGNLRRSIAGTVETDFGSSRVVLSAGGRIQGGGEVPYAATQEYGATIRPVRRQWLAIPSSDVMTGAGVNRFGAPRNYPTPLVFVQKDSSFAMLIDPADGRAKWWLRKQTTIKGKFYARDAIRATERQVEPGTASVLSDALGAE